MRQRYTIRPLEHGMTSEAPSLNLPHVISPSVENVRIDQRSVQNRAGYDSALRDLGAGIKVYGIDIFQISDGSRYTVYLSETDLHMRETASGKTWSYKTDTGDYNTSVASISGATVTFKASTVADSEDIVAGDKFILDTDHTSNVEPDTNWATIQSTANAGGFFTTLTLTGNYSGTTGSWGGAEKDCLIRRVYSMPSDNRWSWAVVDDKFCFTNGNVNVQYWDGSGYAGALDSTNAKKARYCVEYANRLILADVEVSGSRAPYTVQWSKEGDPTDWTDSTAGSADMLRTDDYLMGLGRVGQGIVVYTSDSLIFGNETGVSTAPIEFPIVREGIGCIAPYSIVPVRGTNVFLGRDDFYQIERNDARPIGGFNESRMKHRFFDIVTETEATNTWGAVNSNLNTVHWFANTTEGYRGFTWNYITGEWTEDVYAHEISAMGRGAL